MRRGDGNRRHRARMSACNVITAFEFDLRVAPLMLAGRCRAAMNERTVEIIRGGVVMMQRADRKPSPSRPDGGVQRCWSRL